MDLDPPFNSVEEGKQSFIYGIWIDARHGILSGAVFTWLYVMKKIINFFIELFLVLSKTSLIFIIKKTCLVNLDREKKVWSIKKYVFKLITQGRGNL